MRDTLSIGNVPPKRTLNNENETVHRTVSIHIERRSTVKRLSALILAVAFILSLTGCRQPNLIKDPTATESSASSKQESTELPPKEETSASADSVKPIILPKPEDTDFVRITDYIPNARVELAYATTNNFTGYRIYDFTDCYLRYGTVKKLVKVSEELAKQNIGLIVWDGFRPAAAQAKLWEICPNPTFVSHPMTGKRTHCRGNTVDISLYDLKTGKDLTVPTGYDNFTAYADRDYSDCSEKAAANALLLEQTMKKHGFDPYFSEWWHFSDTVDYPIDEFFNPAIPTTWSANCIERISLRSAPDGEVIAEIPKGDTMELQSWKGRYAEVSYNGRIGYVMTNYIMPKDDSYFDECLDTVEPTNVYSYNKMKADMKRFQKQYPDSVSVASIGSSEFGRDIPVIRIGDLNAKYHILLQGAIHGREHLTAWLLMATVDYWLDHGILGYGDICYHIIPMTNPDGVITSQTGTLTDSQMKIYLSDKQNEYTAESESEYASRWKANGEGIDINRNFPSGWELIDDRTEPSSQQYRGVKPFSSAEAVALRDYTLKYAFDVTISYHSTGSLIYYSYGDREPVNTESKSLAKAVSEISGYDLEDSNGVVGAGYKDWVIEELKIPSLTVEIGCEESALAEREIYSIFVRNYRILPAVARWLQMGH